MQAWQNFLNLLRQELGEDAVDKWLTPLEVDRFDAGNLYLKAQDAFQLTWFEEHIRPHCKKKLLNNNNHPIRVHLIVAQDISPKDRTSPDNEKKTPFQPIFVTDELDPLCTLDNFLCTEENKVPVELLKELVHHKISLGTFNPIYIHGAPATGKTHLLMALANAFHSQEQKVLYIRAETFTEHVVRAIRSSMMLEFRNVYRHVDLLLIDDIQILAKRGATQEELFHTFNALHTLGKQIIIAANSPAGLLNAIEPRLTSRFEWGLTLHLEKLSSLGLKTLLEQRCKALDAPLNPETISYLLKYFGSSPRSILRALEALILYVHMRHHRSCFLLSLDEVGEALRPLFEEEKKGLLDPQKIVMIVADQFGITSGELLGKSQTQSCAVPRQIAMHLCRELLGIPYLKIGAFFHRDHSTVMSSVKMIQKRLLEQDRELATSLALIKQKLPLRDC